MMIQEEKPYAAKESQGFANIYLQKAGETSGHGFRGSNKTGHNTSVTKFNFCSWR